MDLDASQLSPAEHALLLEYQLALSLFKKINAQIERLNKTPTQELHNQLRFLENKIGLLFTLIKSSAFSFIVKHQNDVEYEGGTVNVSVASDRTTEQQLSDSREEQ